MTTPQALPTVAQLIDFAAAHTGPHSGAIEVAIRADLGLAPARYFQLLHRALATVEAVEHDSITTHRLRRAAAAQASIRTARTTVLGI